MRQGQLGRPENEISKQQQVDVQWPGSETLGSGASGGPFELLGQGQHGVRRQGGVSDGGGVEVGRLGQGGDRSRAVEGGDLQGAEPAGQLPEGGS